MFRQDFTCPALLIAINNSRRFEYGAITLYGRTFQTVFLQRLLIQWTGLFPVRSPLLRESRLISFPPDT